MNKIEKQIFEVLPMGELSTKGAELVAERVASIVLEIAEKSFYEGCNVGEDYENDRWFKFCEKFKKDLLGE